MKVPERPGEDDCQWQPYCDGYVSTPVREHLGLAKETVFHCISICDFHVFQREIGDSEQEDRVEIPDLVFINV